MSIFSDSFYVKWLYTCVLVHCSECEPAEGLCGNEETRDADGATDDGERQEVRA